MANELVLNTIVLQAEQIFGESPISQKPATAICLAEHQTARIVDLNPILADNEKNNTIAVYFEDNGIACTPPELDACTTTCGITGTEISAPSVKILEAPACLGERRWTVNPESFKDSKLDWQIEAAKKLTRELKTMDMAVNKHIALWLSGIVGENIMTGNKNETLNPYDLSQMASLSQIAELNYMADAFLLDDGSLYTAYKNAEFEVGNTCCGKGEQARAGAFDRCSDYLLGGYGVIPNTFMIAPDALVIATKTVYLNDLPQEKNASGINITSQRIKSPAIPGFYYDLDMEYKCIGKNQYAYAYRLSSTIFKDVSPYFCGDSNRILGFVKPA